MLESVGRVRTQKYTVQITCTTISSHSAMNAGRLVRTSARSASSTRARRLTRAP